MELVQFKGYKYIYGGVCAAKGFYANGIHCGLAHKPLTDSDENSNQSNGVEPEKKKNDLAAILSEKECAAAAVFTTNKVKAAPVIVTRSHLADGKAKAVIVNSVNANACNADGLEKATAMCKLIADQLNINENDVIVASTGVIGQVLPIEPIQKAVPELTKNLSSNGNEAALEAIMTTDTMPKEVAVEFMLDGRVCRLGGMLKGSGMIHPNMATTLSFLTTDAAITSEMLRAALQETIKTTLNQVSVDGDTSTNDMCCVLANGLAANQLIFEENEDYKIFKGALKAVLVNLSRMMARDGEGATKLIECTCNGAEDVKSAQAVAKSVITSSLFKAAMFGQDANWGRIVCAVGYADAEFDVNRINVDISSSAGQIAVCRNGVGVEFSEYTAKDILAEEEVHITISIGDGMCSATAWGCDLTYNYVKINGDYRS